MNATKGDWTAEGQSLRLRQLFLAWCIAWECSWMESLFNSRTSPFSSILFHFRIFRQPVGGSVEPSHAHFFDHTTNGHFRLPRTDGRPWGLLLRSGIHPKAWYRMAWHGVAGAWFGSSSFSWAAAGGVRLVSRGLAGGRWGRCGWRRAAGLHEKNFFLLFPFHC